MTHKEKLNKSLKMLSSLLQVINFDYNPNATFITYEGEKIVMISDEIEGRVFYEFSKTFLVDKDLILDCIELANDYSLIPIDEREQNSREIVDVSNWV